MKLRILHLIFLLACAIPVLAQSPQKFKFQAVARDAGGLPYVSENIAVRVSLVRDGVSGIVDYAERHEVTTSPLGVFDLEIGGGVGISGSFGAVDWATHPYYLKIDIDPDGGTAYLNLGTSQLLSVPYAIYANQAGNGGGGNPTDELQNLIYNPATQTLTLTDGNSVTLTFPGGGSDDQTLSLSGTTLTIEDGNTVDLSSLQDGVNDADADPNNELQTLNFDPATNELSIVGGNSITIPSSGTDADADPTNEIQTINLSGTTLSLSDGGGSVNLPTDNDSQTLTFNPATNELSISSGNTVTIPTGGTDADADPTNEIQTLSLSGDQLSLSNGGGSVNLPGGSDDQTISLTGTTLNIEDGNSIDLSSLQDGVNDADSDPTNEIETWGTLAGIPADIADGDDVIDSDADPANELQSLSLSGNDLSLSNGGGTISLPGGSDDQSLTLSGTTLSIEDGNAVNLSSLQDGVNDADADPTNEIQTISKAGSTVTLSDGGGSFTDAVNDADADPTNEIETWGTLAGIPADIADGDDVNDADADPTNEIQTISKAGSTVTLSDGGGSFTDAVNDADANPTNEIQTLGLIGNTLGLSNGGGSVNLAGFSNLWSQNGTEIYYNTNGVGIGTDDPEDNMVLHVAGDQFIQTNLGALHLGFPNNGNQWRMSTANGGEDLLFRSKPSGSLATTTRFQMFQDGEFALGNITSPRAWMHLRGNSTVPKPHLILEETQDEFARLGFGNTVHEGYWHIAASARDGASGAANSAMNFWFANDQGAADRMTIKGNGHVGIGNTNPDENFVVGTNLGSGWVIPAATVGGSSGGALEVGTPTINFSTSSSTTFNRARLIATDANGFGQGLIEMRTRQLNIGVAPGVNTTRTYPLRVVQNTGSTGGSYGVLLINGTNAVENWELYVATTSASDGDFVLYHNNSSRGRFDAASGNYTATSDARLKTNVTALTSTLPAMMELQPKRYNYKTNLDRIYNGFLAQELRTIFPEVVTEVAGRDGEESTLMVDYAQLTVLAIGAIQEQQEQIQEQQEKIESLEARLERLEALLKE